MSIKSFPLFSPVLLIFLILGTMSLFFLKKPLLWKEIDHLQREVLLLKQKKQAFENIDQFLVQESTTYQKVMDKAFSLPLNRLQLSEKLPALAEKTCVTLQEFKVFPAQAIEKEGFSYLRTLLHLKAQARLDRDLYYFLYQLQKNLQGLVFVESFTLIHTPPSVEAAICLSIFTATGGQK